MELDQIIARRRELFALTKEIQNSTYRPVRVKLIRLTHMRNEMKALLAQLDATIEDKAKE